MKKFVVLWACWAPWWGKIMGGDGRFGDRDMLSSSVESRLLLGSFCSSIAGDGEKFRPLRAKLHLLLTLPPLSVSSLDGQHVKSRLVRIKRLNTCVMFLNNAYSGDMSSPNSLPDIANSSSL